MKSSIFEGICTECRNRCFEQKLLSTHKVVKNKEDSRPEYVGLSILDIKIKNEWIRVVQEYKKRSPH
ncbi:MAG: hypothetical protein WBP64_00070 [Nitrososphaeraceae archaeon]